MAIVAHLLLDEAFRADREARDIDATVRSGSSGTYDALVRNLSVSGCLVEVQADLVEGDGLSIGVNGLGIVRAIVARRDGMAYGLSFLDELSAAQVVEAGRFDTVVSLRPNQGPALETTMPDPARWSRRRRASIIAGAAVIGWAGIAMALRLLLS